MIKTMSIFQFPLGLGLELGFGLWLRLVFFLITLKRFIFTRTQLKVNCDLNDFENIYVAIYWISSTIA